MTPAQENLKRLMAVLKEQAPVFHTFDRGDQVELAKATVDLLHVIGLLTYDDGEFWHYDADVGVWVRVPREIIADIIAGFAGAPVARGGTVRPLSISQTAISGAANVLRSDLVAKATRRFVEASPGLVFANGFVEVKDGRINITKHAPEHLARHAYPFPFRRLARCPRLKHFLTVLFNDVSPRERNDRIALFQEFIGTALIGEATRHQRALVFFGDGANGKSAALEIGRAAFPVGSVASLPPQLWNQRFQLVRLVGAKANFVDEVPERDITNGEIFKSVITGNPVTIEEKNQPTFEFAARAGHIFSANTLPGTVDQSVGFWRRFVVLNFSRNMEEAAEHVRDAAQPVLEAELPAIVAWFLEGAARVQRRGGYAVPKSSSNRIELWRNDADSVRRFVGTECVLDPSASLSTKKLYTAYNAWARENGFVPLNAAKFFKRLNGTGLKSDHTNKGNVYRCRLLYSMPTSGW